MKNEEMVMKIVARWIEADNSRFNRIPDLLRAVRLEQLSIDSLLSLESWIPGENFIARYRLARGEFP